MEEQKIKDLTDELETMHNNVVNHNSHKALAPFEDEIENKSDLVK